MDTIDEDQTLSRQRRRRFSVEYKRRIVEESLEGPDSVIARRHDVNANQLFRWRQLYRLGELGAPSEGSALTLVPVRLATSEPPPTQREIKGAAPSGSLEIQLVGGHRLVVRGAADAAALRVVLEVLGR